ncbi:MAG TPA: alpha-amylase family glycosyl hydrolase [bacterium]|nr:alpha-amylase family glycosyl hydrolase [bacterium]
MPLYPPSWLEKAVFYQVYPQSFFDSNGDGIGDLPGLTQKLGYLKSMGFNALWLNPCFDSPFQDAGYDVADYYRVAPRYGTNADAKRLFQEAGKKGIRVCLDLVPGHTSLQHPWFKRSAEVESNAYSGRYIWADGSSEIHEPELNLIRGYAERPVGYAANYYYSQPSLNYGFAKPHPGKPWQVPVTHPDARATAKEMLNIMRFWMRMGAAGFRVDMAGSLVKQDSGQSATIRLWSGLSKSLKREFPEAFLISEWSDPARAIRAGFDADFLIHFGPHAKAYNCLFRLGAKSFFRPEGKGDPRPFLSTYLRLLKAAGKRGYISVPSGNHDFSRLSVGRTSEDLKVCFAFLLTLPGLPFVYYGDEIGMAYQGHLPSKEGGYDRTGSRTPMQWDEGKNRGFSKARREKLYLPVDRRRGSPDVAAQEGEPDSLLETVRGLIRLRQNHPALGAKGSFKVLADGRGKKPLVYLREGKKERILVALNPGAKGTRLKLKVRGRAVPLALQRMQSKTNHDLDCGGVSYGIFRLV